MRQIKNIFIYPIKSCGGVAVEKAEVTPTGLKHDRQFVLVDDHGKFLSQRHTPKMCLIKVNLGEKAIFVSHPDSSCTLVIPHQEYPDSPSIPIDIWGKIGYGVGVANNSNEWFSDILGVRCRLLQYDPRNPRRRKAKEPEAEGIPLSFADGFPILLISEESLADLNHRLEEPVTMDRFRPNIVVTGGDHAFEEDAWRCLSTKGVCFTGQKPCERCSMPEINPKTGTYDKEGEPIATLKTYRRAPPPSGKKSGPVIFGKNLSVRRPGTIYTGNVLIAN